MTVEPWRCKRCDCYLLGPEPAYFFRMCAPMMVRDVPLCQSCWTLLVRFIDEYPTAEASLTSPEL